MEELIEKIKKFRDERNWKQFHSVENLAKSISIEAGELLENFQWDTDYEVVRVSEELADIFIYCILMADTLGLDIIDMIDKKIKINEKKYPVELSKDSSKKYTVINKSKGDAGLDNIQE